ncbi:MAG: sulfatase-like hydrolase/transferase [Archangium sp.]|nr:sulfatase-like hydrolase/transferase [Archangium sp.]
MRVPADPPPFWLCLLLCTGCLPGGDAYRIAVDRPALARRDAFVAGPVRAAPRLNVVVMLADDLGVHDTSLSPTGAVKTPGLERLAAGGVTLGQASVTAPICSPSRAALLTGRYQQRFGHEGQPHERYARNALEAFFFRHFIAGGDWQYHRPVAPDLDDVQRQGLPQGEVTLAELLARHGYATGAFGKWHLGWNEASAPHRRGFDTHVGFYEAYTLYQQDLASPSVVNQRHEDVSDQFIWGKGRSGTAQLVRNGVPFEDDGYLPDTLTGEAIAFIEAHRNENFFVYLPMQNPHTPFQAKKALFDRFADEPDHNRRVYKALIASLDECVTRVLDALDRHGLADDTLVIFLSDNGATLYTKAGDNRPLQGGKFTLFEGGVRVPMVMRWPKRLPAGQRYEQPVSALDVFATIAAGVGAELPSGLALDGVDLAPYLAGENTAAPHEWLFWRAEYAQAVRHGRWKLVRDTWHGTSALFDLEVDPGEKVDLSSAEPARVAELSAAWELWNAGNRGPLWPHVMEYRFTADDGREFWYPL